MSDRDKPSEMGEIVLPENFNEREPYLEVAEITIARDWQGNGWIFECPEHLRWFIEYPHIEDSIWKGHDLIPTAVGVHKVKAEFFYSPGYMEGYFAPGESDYHIRILNPTN